MNFLHYEPESEVLKEFIDFFYFLKADYTQPVQFFAFPHYRKALNIHKGIEYTIGNNEITVAGSGNYRSKMLLQGVYLNPILIRFSGQIDKVTIIFRDGALSNFTPRNFSDMGSCHTQLFSEWESSPGYTEFIELFFSESDHRQQLRILERFLLSVLDLKPDWEIYKKAAVLLKDVEANHKISEVARQVHMSERTLYRLIHRYNGISPLNYRKTIQFRHSLQNKLVSDQFKLLTDVAYGSNYYDPSYFTKIYKSLTKRSPKAFFRNVDMYCNKKIIFEWR